MNYAEESFISGRKNMHPKIKYIQKNGKDHPIEG
jgi:hypothetical protein